MISIGGCSYVSQAIWTEHDFTTLWGSVQLHRQGGTREEDGVSTTPETYTMW